MKIWKRCLIVIVTVGIVFLAQPAQDSLVGITNVKKACYCPIEEVFNDRG